MSMHGPQVPSKLDNYKYRVESMTTSPLYRKAQRMSIYLQQHTGKKKNRSIQAQIHLIGGLSKSTMALMVTDHLPNGIAKA